MAHKTLINGTAYEVTGGKCLVNGTGYSIQKGRTLVSGTGYDIAFESDIPVTITSSGDSTYCYVEFDGQKYISGTFSAHEGDVLTFSAGGPYPSITIDGIEVAGGTLAFKNITYDYQIPPGTNEIKIKFSTFTMSSTTTGSISVTTS